MRLSELLDKTDLDVLVLPLHPVSSVVKLGDRVSLSDAPPEGVELVRGGNPHTLTADVGAARWTASAHDPLGLAAAYGENTGPTYLVHPEHGATGIAPGRRLVRRRREHVAVRRASGASSGWSGSALVVD